MVKEKLIKCMHNILLLLPRIKWKFYCKTCLKSDPFKPLQLTKEVAGENYLLNLSIVLYLLKLRKYWLFHD